MLPPQCHFCDHVNPAGAKFCTDCGSPLDVKRCSRCNAVNDQAARFCSTCSMGFPALSEAPPMSPAEDSAAASPAFNDGFRYFDLKESPERSSSDADVAAAAPESVASEPAFATVGLTAPGLALPAVPLELDKVDANPEDRSSGTTVPPPLSEWLRTTAKVPLSDPGAVTEPRAKSRVALTMSLILAALLVIGIGAYYHSSRSVQPGEGQDAQAVSAAGVPPSPASSGPYGSGSVDTVGTAKPAPLDEPSAAVTIPPVGQGTAATAGSNGAGRQIQSPNEPHARISTIDQASPAQQGASNPDGVLKRSGAETVDAGDLRDRGAPVAGNEIAAKPSAANRPMRTYPAASAARSPQPPLNDGRANVRDEPRPCTEGVTALGLCSPN